MSYKGSIISTDNLSFAYKENKILKKIDLYVPKENIVSLIGPNGSGKSTLLRCLAGLLKSSNDTVYIKGQAIEKYKTKSLSQKIAFLPQFQESLNSISVYDLVAMGRMPYHKSGWLVSPKDKEKIEWAMQYMSLTNYKNRSVNALSGGERQRVWIAMILAQDTPILLLDEPVTYMDLKYQQEFLSMIKDLKENHGKTIISVFHDINHAMEVSDLVYMMQDGEIYKKGEPEEVLTEESILEIYNVYAHVCKFKKCRRNVIVPEGVKYISPKNKHKHKHKYKNKRGD